MSKISLILEREYMSRVKKKTFIIMTLISPLLFSLIFIIPAILAIATKEDKKIQVIDESGLFINKLKSTEELGFEYVNTNLETAKNQVRDGDISVLYIPKIDIEKPEGITLYSSKSMGIETEESVAGRIEDIIKNEKLKRNGISPEVVEKLEADVDIKTFLMSEEGEKTNSSGAATAFGFIGAFLIYIFIFLYGAQVMRGVMEEKTNRIIEVLISSIKPFDLMMGKVLGIAMVGLTQFIIWVVLTAILVTGGGYALQQFAGINQEQVIEARTNSAPMPEKLKEESKKKKAQVINQVTASISTINIPKILACFIFYFLGGYLLYASLFAAIGSAVDNETDVQQFMTPITIPLILSIIVAQVSINNPDSSLVFWFSMIPFTSPIIMMMRLPFNPPMWEIALSMGILVAGFFFTIFLASRIYRVGILMYGKKPTYKELSKWLFYKE